MKSSVIIRKIEKAIIALVITLAPAHNGLAATEEPMVITPHEIALSAYHQGVLLDDLPIKDCYMDQDEYVVWLLGNASLWRWTLNPRKLERIKINADAKDTMLILDGLYPGLTKNEMFVTGNKAFFQAKLYPDEILRRFPHPYYKGGHTVALTLEHDTAYWFHTDAAFKIELKSQKVNRIDFNYDPGLHDFVLMDPQTHYLWHASGSRIDIDSWSNATSRWDRHVTSIDTLNPIVNMIASGSSIFAYTERNLFSFSPSGTITHQVEVNSFRNLRKMNISNSHHFFLFDDGLMQLVDLADRSVNRYRFAGRDVSSVQKICSNKGLLLYLENSRPHLLMLGNEPD